MKKYKHKRLHKYRKHRIQVYLKLDDISSPVTFGWQANIWKDSVLVETTGSCATPEMAIARAKEIIDSQPLVTSDQSKNKQKQIEAFLLAFSMAAFAILKLLEPVKGQPLLAGTETWFVNQLPVVIQSGVSHFFQVLRTSLTVVGAGCFIYFSYSWYVNSDRY